MPRYSLPSAAFLLIALLSGPVLSGLVLAGPAWGDTTATPESCHAAQTGDNAMAVACSELGQALFARGDDRGAEAVLADAWRLRPGSRQVYGQLNALYLKQRRLDDAIKLTREAIQAHPDDAKLQSFLGSMLMMTGDNIGAEAALRRAQLGLPDDPDVLSNLGFVLSAQKRSAEAVPLFRRALALQPTDFAANRGLGDALLILGDDAGSAAAYEIAYQQDPTSRPVVQGFCVALLHLGKDDAAIDLLKHHLRADPQDGEGYYYLGKLYLMQDRRAEGEAALNKAKALGFQVP
ncbi:tetratricopeptide repeat protein [Dongia soli]|uniref:Tetratricopeptide repeat protein n=1 Tax=Dongia soli TaxID=600628 RepID=A0ABU5EEP9_9PROT|nr:tetratricopeptide repeat protein [Dongia soli]MDY0884860.1 tetratricopeptide repeat protein [Dongia soli]